MNLQDLQNTYPTQEISQEAYAFEHLKAVAPIVKVRVLRTKVGAYFSIHEKLYVLSPSALLPFVRAHSSDAVDEFFRRFEKGTWQSGKGNTRVFLVAEASEKIVREVTLVYDERGVLSRRVRVLERSPFDAKAGDAMPMPRR